MNRCLLALVALSLCMCTSKDGINKPKVPHIDTSIVRLHDIETGRFFCSGVIISDTQLLTAAHCVLRAGLFGYDVVKKVEVRAANGRPLGIYADFINANPRQDVALLSGSFYMFDRKEVEIAPIELEKSYMQSKHLKACGYPEGGALVCTDVKKVTHMNFGFSADGFLYPGMSGGPVIDEDTGKVIGVNTAVFESRIYLSPTIELYNQLL